MLLKSVDQKKPSGRDGFISTFFQILLTGKRTILHKLFQRIQKEMAFPNMFYKKGINLKPKLHKNIIRMHHHRTISLLTINANILS